jgi:hypothetical protein
MSIRVLSASPWTSSGSGRIRYQIASPIMVRKRIATIATRGLSAGPRGAEATLDPVAPEPAVAGGVPDGGASVIVSQPR